MADTPGGSVDVKTVSSDSDVGCKCRPSPADWLADMQVHTTARCSFPLGQARQLGDGEAGDSLLEAEGGTTGHDLTRPTNERFLASFRLPNRGANSRFSEDLQPPETPKQTDPSKTLR